MFEFEWFGKEVLEGANSVIAKVNKEVAENVMEDAKTILKQKAETTTDTGLLSQFDIVKSKFDDKTCLVRVQGSGNWKPPYHASFLELGTYKDEAKPFMRPATKKNKGKANKMYQEALDKL